MWWMLGLALAPVVSAAVGVAVNEIEELREVVERWRREILKL